MQKTNLFKEPTNNHASNKLIYGTNKHCIATNNHASTKHNFDTNHQSQTK